MNLRIIHHTIITLGILAALAGCGGGGGGGSTRSGDVFAPPSPRIFTLAEAQNRARWTVLVYLDADNDLESAGIHNFNQMEMIGSTQDVHVIVQMDRRRGDDPSNDHWTDTRRYLIINDSDALKMDSIRLDNPALGELNMSKPATLRNFVQWGMAQFPADHYMLIVWDHGTGWQVSLRSLTPATKYVAMDSTSNEAMNISDIPVALSGINLDVIAFDACYMQELEVAYELRGCGSYLVGSCAAEPSAGYNYARLLSHVTGDMDPQQLARVVVEQYAAEYPEPKTGITQSAIDLGKIGAVVSDADTFARMLKAKAVDYQAELASATTGTLDYNTGGAPYSLDLLEYATRCSEALGPDGDPACSDLRNALSAVIVASTHNSDMPTANGLAIYAPPAGQFEDLYSTTLLAHDTQWDEWLRAQLR